jgi:hypothetical protein
MPDLAGELWAVQDLAALCGMNVTNIRDAKTALGPVERGSLAAKQRSSPMPDRV